MNNWINKYNTRRQIIKHEIQPKEDHGAIQVRSSSSISLALSLSFTLKRSVVFQESYTTFTQTCNVDQILLQKIFMECKKEKLIRTRNLSWQPFITQLNIVTQKIMMIITSNKIVIWFNSTVSDLDFPICRMWWKVEREQVFN